MHNLFEQDFLTILSIVLAISFVTIINIILGLSSIYLLDNYIFYLGSKDFEFKYVNSTSLTILLLNILLTFTLIVIIVYLIGNFTRKIPFPFIFNNIDYSEIQNLYTETLIFTIMIAFSQTLSRQYKEIKFKINGKIY